MKPLPHSLGLAFPAQVESGRGERDEPENRPFLVTGAASPDRSALVTGPRARSLVFVPPETRVTGDPLARYTRHVVAGGR
jgi:hypothetical protein